MLRRSILISGISGLAAFSGLALAQSMSSTSAEKALPYSKRPEVKKFIQDVCSRRGLNQDWVAAVLDQATYQPKIERLMTPKRTKPGTKDTRKDWEKYRNIFLGAHRLNLGVQFWKDNETSLERAREIYHVDPAVIIGIIGVETRYGENTGNWKVLDSLVTLSFDYKRRADFFKKELEEKMELLQMDPSYAERDLNVGFSGGEKKKTEILQMLMLNPEFVILDETDSGLDVDAVRTVSKGIEAYRKQSKGSLLVITHSTKILEALPVDYTHIMVNGKIVKTSDSSLIEEVNENGFAAYENAE